MPPIHPHAPELLAPAGGPDALRAAVAAGADAVYLGLAELNARRGAENFDSETLEEACRFAHLHGVSVYLTANVLVLPHEIERAVELVGEAWAAGVDAVIVQDVGLMRVVRAALPQVRLHASTQVNTHSSLTVDALAALGVSRITLARETSLEQISGLVEAGRRQGVEIESFVHGALCVCYSGQCLLSSMVGGRSANRGMCAQPCRLPYELVNEAEEELGTVGAHLLSPKDLASITLLPQLASTGLAALKIEGRMKSPEYVALVVGVYRGALDRALAAPDAYEVRQGEIAVLSEAFSRGFTEGYLVGERGNDLMSYRRPNNRGVPIGRVSSVRAGRATLSLDVALDAEDTLEFWTSEGRFAQKAGPLETGERTSATAAAGTRVTLSTERTVNAGDRVFRVRNAALEQAAQRLYRDPHARPIPLSFHVRVVIGEPIRVSVSDAQGRSGSALGPNAEGARTKAVSAAEVMEHVGRLGGTPYTASEWDVELSPGVGVGFSVLHRLRREAIADYEREALEPWSGRHVGDLVLPRLSRSPAVDRPAPRVVSVVADLHAARRCLEAGADLVHVPWWAAEGREPVANVRVVTGRTMFDEEAPRQLAAVRDWEGSVAATLGALRALAGEGAAVEAHWSLNSTNAHSVAQLAELGAAAVWLSPELSLQQIAEMRAVAGAPLGVSVYGRQELMVTEHCVLMSEGPCTGACESCTRRKVPKWLRDRKGYRFPVVTDPTGRTHLYNSVPLDVTASLQAVLDSGVPLLRLDLDTESPVAAAQQTARVRAAVDAALRGSGVNKPETAITTGHYFRGVR